nr:hypothetical protein [Bacteroidota bacterium]
YTNSPIPNKLLNNSFLKIEKLLDGCRFEVKNYKSEQEINEILYFSSSLKWHEEKLLKKYLSTFCLKNDSHLSILNIEKLNNILHNIRGIYSHYIKKQTSFITRLKCKFTEKNYMEKSIEKFIIELENNS